MSGGILFSSNDNSVNSLVDYDSRNKKIHIQYDEDPKHLDIIDLTGGTVYPNDGNLYTETLFQIKHGLPFIPNCFVYFFVKEAPDSGSFFQFIGQFTKNYFLMSGTSPFGDFIYYTIDDTFFSIKHDYSNGVGGGQESDQFKFKIRYMLTSNDRGYRRVTFSAT